MLGKRVSRNDIFYKKMVSVFIVVNIIIIIMMINNNNSNINNNNDNNIKILSFVSQCRHLICIVTFRLHAIGLPWAMWSVCYLSPYKIVTCLLHHRIALNDCAELKYHL